MIKAFKPFIDPACTSEGGESAPRESPQKRSGTDYESEEPPAVQARIKPDSGAFSPAGARGEPAGPTIQIGIDTDCDEVLRPMLCAVLSAPALAAWQDNRPFSSGRYCIKLWTKAEPDWDEEWTRTDLVTEEAELGFNDVELYWEMVGEKSVER